MKIINDREAPIEDVIPHFPKSIEIDAIATALDGGSIHLHCIDAKKNEFNVILWQDFDNETESRHLPGRVYINSCLVPIRSDLEKELVAALKKAKIQINYPNKQHNIKNLETVNRLINYINSDVYTKNT